MGPQNSVRLLPLQPLCQILQLIAVRQHLVLSHCWHHHAAWVTDSMTQWQIWLVRLNLTWDSFSLFLGPSPSTLPSPSWKLCLGVLSRWMCWVLRWYSTHCQVRWPLSREMWCNPPIQADGPVRLSVSYLPPPDLQTATRVAAAGCLFTQSIALCTIRPSAPPSASPSAAWSTSGVIVAVALHWHVGVQCHGAVVCSASAASSPHHTAALSTKPQCVTSCDRGQCWWPKPVLA